MKRLIAEQIDQLLAFFEPHCRDTETLKELRSLLHVPQDWIKAHYLSSRIRTKAVSAVKQGDLKAEMQFSFEETCAKTLHNLTDSKKPFDADTAYWILPQALKLAKTLDLDPRKILDIAMS
jgi:hypothetical protein